MDTQTFTVDSTRHNDGWILTLKGELDLATVPCIQEVLDSWMIVPNHLIVDTSQVSFIDSTGLRVLFRAQELVGGRFSLRHPSEPTRRLLELSGPANMIQIEESQETKEYVPSSEGRDLPGTSQETSLGSSFWGYLSLTKRAHSPSPRSLATTRTRSRKRGAGFAADFANGRKPRSRFGLGLPPKDAGREKNPLTARRPGEVSRVTSQGDGCWARAVGCHVAGRV